MPDDNGAFVSLQKARKQLESWTGNLLRQQISKINAAIRDDLNDPTLLPIYKVSTVKQYGSSCYGRAGGEGENRIVFSHLCNVALSGIVSP